MREVRGIGVTVLLKKLTGLVLIVLVSWQLLACSQVAATGVRQALAVCASVLIPSLFPFMVLSSLLPSTAAGRLLSMPFGLVARFCYRLPPVVAPALLMSWIGGYPAGARALAELVDRGDITPDDAGEALVCCVNSGPAFMVTVVGVGIFGSGALGLRLFGCQLAAGMLTGLLMGVRLPRRGIRSVLQQDKPLAETLVGSVTSAATAMVSMSAFVVLMGAVLALLQANGAAGLAARAVSAVALGWVDSDTASVLVSGLLEICTGCAAAARLAPLDALKVLPMLLSFGGVAVICQVMAAIGMRGVPMKRMLLSRPLHGVLTALLAYPLLRGECAAVSTGFITSPQLYSDERALPMVAIMLASCAFLCFVVEEGSDKVL